MGYYHRWRGIRKFLARILLCPIGIHGDVEPIDVTHPFFYGPYYWVCGRCWLVDPRIAFAPKVLVQSVANDDELSMEDWWKAVCDSAEVRATNEQAGG